MIDWNAVAYAPWPPGEPYTRCMGDHELVAWCADGTVSRGVSLITVSLVMEIIAMSRSLYTVAQAIDLLDELKPDLMEPA